MLIPSFESYFANKDTESESTMEETEEEGCSTLFKLFEEAQELKFVCPSFTKKPASLEAPVFKPSTPITTLTPSRSRVFKFPDEVQESFSGEISKGCLDSLWIN